MIIYLGAQDIECSTQVERVELPVPPETVTVDLVVPDFVVAFSPMPPSQTGPP
jgi:hypothetical protein